MKMKRPPTYLLQTVTSRIRGTNLETNLIFSYLIDGSFAKNINIRTFSSYANLNSTESIQKDGSMN